MNDLLAWKGWDDVTSEQEYCVEGFASSSVNIDQGSGLRNMWTDIRADVRFADGVLLNFFGDNPLIGAPMVGWSTGGDEAGWGSETLNSRNSKSVTYGGRTFTVERRADSDYNKEFLITFTR